MITIYDLLEVDEKASKTEIQNAYQKLILEYGQDPKLTPEENADNELIMNKVKIAYEILMNDEKRAKYDRDLSKKRAEELLQSVSSNNEIAEEQQEEQTEALNQDSSNEQQTRQEIKDQEYDDGDEGDLQYENVEDDEDEESDDDVTLSKEEQKKLQNIAKKEFKNNLKKAKKAEEEYNKAYNEAYNSYMRKMGYNVKEPLTLKRIMNVVIFVVATIIVCVIAWIIPPIRNLLIDLYNENIIIKALVDIVVAIFRAIIGIFK